MAMKARASPSDCLVPYAGHYLGGEVLPLCRDAVGLFYKPRRLGWLTLNVTMLMFLHSSWGLALHLIFQAQGPEHEPRQNAPCLPT